MQPEAAVSKLHITQSQLLCKTGCGFFGNVAWQGYCSKCYKVAYLRKEQRQPNPAAIAPMTNVTTGKKVGRSVSDVGIFGRSPNFAKFEEKKKQQQEAKSNTMKALFRKTPTKSMAGTPARSVRSHSPETHQVTQELGRFLQSIGHQAGHEAYQYLRSFLERVSKLNNAGLLTQVDELAELLQDTYQNFEQFIKENVAFKGLSSHKVEVLLDLSEKYLTACLYRQLFCPPGSDDEEKDLALQKRIRSLNWISAPLLECGISELLGPVRELLDRAITHMIEIDGQRSPQGKIDCVTKASKLVFDILNISSQAPSELSSQFKTRDPVTESNDESLTKNPSPAEITAFKDTRLPVSADDFLPAIIYVVLKANPPRLHSNVNFVTRCAPPKRLQAGEGAYYFTNLCCAVSFIESMSGNSLGISEEEFQSYMQGQSVPLPSLQTGVLLGEGLRLMHAHVATLSAIRRKQDLLFSETEALKAEMTEFHEILKQQVCTVVAKHPILIKNPEPTELEVQGRRIPCISCNNDGLENSPTQETIPSGSEGAGDRVVQLLGRLKLTDQAIVFKNAKTGKVEQLSSGDIEFVNWQRLAGAWGIRIFMKNGMLHRFGGFKDSDQEKLAKFFTLYYKKDLLEKELSVKGWNWGTAKFNGSVLSMDIGNNAAFEIPLSNVSQCTTGKNEVTLEFHQNDEAPVSLMEMRYYIPSSELSGDDPVDNFQKQVMQKASVISMTGDAWANFSEVQCLTPRGRYDMKVFGSFIQLHGKTFDYKIPTSSVLRLFLLPHRDGRQMYFVVSLDPPIKQGQTRYHFLVFLFNNDEEITVELLLSE
nr:EOG090X03G5 [Lepidurus arcticus]